MKKILKNYMDIQPNPYLKRIFLFQDFSNKFSGASQGEIYDETGQIRDVRTPSLSKTSYGQGGGTVLPYYELNYPYQKALQKAEHLYRK